MPRDLPKKRPRQAGQISRTPSHDSPDGTKTSAAWHWRPTLSGPELHEAVKRHFRVEPVANALNWRNVGHESVVENFKPFFLHTAELGVRLSMPQLLLELKRQFASEVRVLREFARTLCDAERECWLRTKRTTTGERTSKAIWEVIEAHKGGTGAGPLQARRKTSGAVLGVKIDDHEALEYTPLLPTVGPSGHSSDDEQDLGPGSTLCSALADLEAAKNLWQEAPSMASSSCITVDASPFSVLDSPSPSKPAPSEVPVCVYCARVCLCALAPPRKTAHEALQASCQPTTLPAATAIEVVFAFAMQLQLRALH